MIETTVLIVGGGLAGLSAAHDLHRAGIDFQLLEARPRFGGRILTVDAQGEVSPDGFDLGPSWYWPGMHPAMAQVVRELGLRDFPQHSAGDVVVERSRGEAPLRFPAMRQEPQSMRLAGGTGALIATLLDRLPRAQLHPECRVTRLSLRDDDVLVSYAKGAEAYEARAGQVILASPPRLLATGISFDPALPQATLARWRETPTWMAPHAKFFALYDHAFWRDNGLSGTAQSAVGPLVEIHDATTASGAAALFGFIGLDRRQRAELGEDMLVRLSVAQLGRTFGPAAAQPRATLIKDWSADPFTATQADAVAEGHPVPSPGPWVSGSWAGRLSLAGSETSSSDPGYLAGALDAAARATGEALQRLAG